MEAPIVVRCVVVQTACGPHEPDTDLDQHVCQSPHKPRLSCYKTLPAYLRCAPPTPSSMIGIITCSCPSPFLPPIQHHASAFSPLTASCRASWWVWRTRWTRKRTTWGSLMWSGLSCARLVAWHSRLGVWEEAHRDRGRLRRRMPGWGDIILHSIPPPPPHTACPDARFQYSRTQTLAVHQWPFSAWRPVKLQRVA